MTFVPSTKRASIFSAFPLDVLLLVDLVGKGWFSLGAIGMVFTDVAINLG